MFQPIQQSQKHPQSPSKTPSVAPATQPSGAPSAAPSVATLPTHDDISQRAYDIYAESGYQQGQSNQNWVRAEKDLSARGTVARQTQHQEKSSFALPSADPR